MHDKARRQMAAEQTVVRLSDCEVSAQQIEPLVRTEIFADREVEGRAVVGRKGRGPAAVVHDVPWVTGKQKNVAGLQLQRSAPGRIFQRCGAGEHGVIRDFVGLTGSLIDAPRRAVGAAQIEPSAHRHHPWRPPERTSASHFLGVSEWTFGSLLLAGFWDKRLGVLGALGSTGTFIATVTIIPFMPEGWDIAAGGFPAMTGNVPFLLKDVVLLAASLYLLRQDVVRLTRQ
jgi:hypothetical protein